MDPELKIPNSKINMWKETTYREFSSKIIRFKINQFNVKLFWEKMSLQEKEECLLISNSNINHYLTYYMGILECNLLQVFISISIYL